MNIYIYNSLTSENNITKMINYIILEPLIEEYDHKKCYKYPFVCCEIFSIGK